MRSLTFVEAVVVLLEHLLGALDVADLARRLHPRHRQQPVDVVARHRGLGGHRRHALEALELGERLVLDLLGHAGGLDALGELLELLLGVGAAELLVDRLDLLGQVVLALRLLHLLLDLGVEAAVDVELLDLDVEEVVELLQPLERVHDLEQRLLVGRRDRQRGGEHVGEQLGILGLQLGEGALDADLLRQPAVLLEQRRPASTGSGRPWGR